MAKCANNKCSNEVVSLKGKRARLTCSDSCRQIFLKQRVAESKLSKVVTIAREEWERLKGLDDRTNPLINAARARDACGINFDEVTRSEIEQQKELSTLASTNPKNLQELRESCPKELYGMDRSNWMRENRVKYNL